MDGYQKLVYRRHLKKAIRHLEESVLVAIAEESDMLEMLLAELAMQRENLVALEKLPERVH